MAESHRATRKEDSTGLLIRLYKIVEELEERYMQSVVLSDPDTGESVKVSLAGLKTNDDYQAGEVLADQNGAGAALTFTFSSEVQLVVVESNGTLDSRCDPFGGVPTAMLGIPCRDKVPVYIPVAATVVQVFAQVGSVVSVWGFKRA
jgi:hypothetical protein